MKRYNLISALLILIFSSASCLAQKQEKGDFLTRAMDTTVDPGENFFQYATGNWMKENPIPATESRWGLASLIKEETYKRLRGILEDASTSSAAKGTAEQKLGDFYATGMDTLSIEKQGFSPLQPELDKINAISTKEDLFKTAALLQKEGVGVMFGLYIGQDDKNSEVVALHLWQSGLGLPNREYYFRDDERTKNIREEYKNHLANEFGLIGDDASAAAKKEQSRFMKSRHFWQNPPGN